MNVTLDRSEYQKRYRAEHREKQKAYMALYYTNNSEKLKARARTREKANPERTLVVKRRWRMQNAAKMKDSRRKWEEKNRDNYQPRKLELQRMRNSAPERRAEARVRAKEYKRKNPDQTRRTAMEWHYRSKYGITVAERDQLFEAQGKRCKICRSDSSKGRGFHVDHCHRRKKIRGIVCHNCNILLGNAKESITTLEAAIQYLKESE